MSQISKLLGTSFRASTLLYSFFSPLHVLVAFLTFSFENMSIFIQKLLAKTLILKSLTNPSCHLLDTAYDSHRYAYFLITCSVSTLSSYWE